MRADHISQNQFLAARHGSSSVGFPGLHTATSEHNLDTVVSYRTKWHSYHPALMKGEFTCETLLRPMMDCFASPDQPHMGCAFFVHQDLLDGLVRIGRSRARSPVIALFISVHVQWRNGKSIEIGRAHV